MAVPAHRQAVRRLRIALVGALAVATGAGFAVDMHPHFAFERLPAFFALLGFASCAAIVGLAVVLGRLLGREEGRHDR